MPTVLTAPTQADALQERLVGFGVQVIHLANRRYGFRRRGAVLLRPYTDRFPLNPDRLLVESEHLGTLSAECTELQRIIGASLRTATLRATTRK